MIEMSSGTRMWLRVISCSTPSAIRSFAQKTAVGRDDAGIAAIDAPARCPAKTFSASVSITMRSSAATPTRRSARSAPSCRSATCRRLAGPAT